MISKEELRSAMSQFATGVTVITTVDDEGEPHSMTANSFTSVCLDPPIVLVCVSHGTYTYGYLSHTGQFGVNILTEQQDYLGIHFARRPEQREAGVKYTYSLSQSGIPVLEESMVFLGCKVVGSHVYGDHTIFLGEVEEVRQSESNAPLLFFRSRWYSPDRGAT